MSYKETKVKKISLEIDPNTVLNEIRDTKPEQCCFKKRLVDGFIVGATRAYYKGRNPKILSSSKKDKIDSIPTPELKDKENIIFYLQIIAYAHLLDQAGKDENKKNDIHHVLIDLNQCTKISEEYFKGNWEIPEKNNFKEICTASYPDSMLIDDLSLQNEIVEEKD